jgi:hypothetical protein
MRHVRLLVVGAQSLVAACANLIGFPDVPDVEDSGIGDASGSGDRRGSRLVGVLQTSQGLLLNRVPDHHASGPERREGRRGRDVA